MYKRQILHPGNVANAASIFWEWYIPPPIYPPDASRKVDVYKRQVIKEFSTVYAKKKEEIGAGNILVYPIGKKLADALKKQGIAAQGDYRDMADKPTFLAVQDLSLIHI